MIKTLFAGILFLLSSLAVASVCGNALPIDNPAFCSSFKKVAICYCTGTGLPAPLCQDMRMLYARMIAVYRTLENACAHQSHTSKENCVANWNCYRTGIGKQQTDDHRIANCLSVCERF